MGAKPKEMLGKRFGRWTIIAPSCRRTPQGVAYWYCVCKCGTRRNVAGDSLRAGKTISCSCVRGARHGHTIGHRLSSTYVSWLNMRYRCNGKNGSWYSEYGGRGIKVCKRWNSFANFLTDMGSRPVGKTLDRKNVNGNYHKRNCRWATASQQSWNRRRRKSSSTVVTVG